VGRHAREADAGRHGEVVLRHHALMLPKTGDKYASALESTPSLSRWRIEADRWRMFYFTSHKGTALAEMKKDGVE
jgi:hypothetical protein